MSLSRCTLLLLAFLLPACASVERDGEPDDVPVDISSVPDAVPKVEPKSRYGNPSEYVVFGETYRVMDSADGFRERGKASWYGTKFHGRRTSSGEPYDMYAMTAAHKSLPLPTYVRVTNLENGRSVVVRVNDRGPFHDGRIIDLSYVAALKLDVVSMGTADVEIVAIDPRAGENAVSVDTLPENQSLQAEAIEAPAEPVEHALAMTASGGADLASEFFIQLGAFGERGNAQAMSDRLAAAGFFPVGIHPEGSLHRVRLGPLATREAAEEITLRLIAEGIEQFRIIEEGR